MSACLAVVGVGVAIWRVIELDREARRWRIEADKREEAVLGELKVLNAAPKWVNANDVHHNCYTDNSDVTCFFTNLSDAPVTTCTRGRLVQKEAQGVKLESTVMCTGKLTPSETKAVRAPWVGGFARDLCNSKSAFGGTTLDWSVCKFDTEAFDLPAVRKIAEATRK